MTATAGQDVGSPRRGAEDTMPPHTRTLTRAARDRARHTGEGYQAARAALLAQSAEPAPPVTRATARYTVSGGDRALILTPAPTAAAGDTAGDAAGDTGAGGGAGWRCVLAVRTPRHDRSADLADRILAEARWARITDWPRETLGDGDEATVELHESVPAARAVREAHREVCAPDRPCTCSTYRLTGKVCDHGTACPEPGCGGRIVHADRYPGSLWSVQVWQDVHACTSCDSGYASYLELPDLPWGEHNPGPSQDGQTITGDGQTITGDGQTITGTRAFPGTRHPADSDAFWESCGECGASGGYRCNCGTGRCQECGADEDYGCNCW